MICAYLLFKGLATSAEEAMQIYAQQRSTDSVALTVESQKRHADLSHLKSMPCASSRTSWRLVSISRSTMISYSMDMDSRLHARQAWTVFGIVKIMQVSWRVMAGFPTHSML